jgi:hypothetical protein
MVALSRALLFTRKVLNNTTTPFPYSRDSVCPLPLSLAVNHGIEISFSSFGYLDDSVPRVPVPKKGQFRHLWFKECMLLARAYRSLPRPLSALEPSYPLFGILLP